MPRHGSDSASALYSKGENALKEFKAETALFCPLPAEFHVLFDLVVQIEHALNRMPHPKLPRTLWTFGSIAQVRVPETPESLVACLAGACERVDEPQLLQRRMKVPANDVG
jgi:hypothetical protein